MITALVLIIRRNSRDKEIVGSPAGSNFYNDDVSQETILIYKGKELNFSDEIMISVLEKHFPYFNALPEDRKDVFLQRLKKFIALKTFVIHNKSGFREMPILISATAIKLSMGFEHFTLPHYTHIHIFPEAFLGVYPSLRVLAGNVSGNRIHISWKHFLEGYQFPEDGQNVGLHEMAHAYYYQHFETGEDVEENFVNRFDMFTQIGNAIFEKEKQSADPLYSSYALKNFQEFWAESVELFFEKPDTFKSKYTALYYILVNMLNQDPGEMS